MSVAMEETEFENRSKIETNRLFQRIELSSFHREERLHESLNEKFLDTRMHVVGTLLKEI